jgi:hypothetical protein
MILEALEDAEWLHSETMPKRIQKVELLRLRFRIGVQPVRAMTVDRFRTNTRDERTFKGLSMTTQSKMVSRPMNGKGRMMRGRI